MCCIPDCSMCCIPDCMCRFRPDELEVLFILGMSSIGGKYEFSGDDSSREPNSFSSASRSSSLKLGAGWPSA